MDKGKGVKHKLTLRYKLLIYTFATLILGAVIIASFLLSYIRGEAYRELVEKARSVSVILSSQITEKILIDDYVGIEKTLDLLLEKDRDARYVFIEKEGYILVHTFNGGFPMDLLNLKKRGVMGEVVFISHGKRYLDLRHPVWGGRAGILHLGYSLDYLDSELKETLRRIVMAVLITIIILGCISILVTRWLTRPLSMLTLLSERFSRGDYTGGIFYSGDDEIGKLCLAFEKMRDALNERERMLRKRGEELEEVNMKLHEYIQELDRTREELIRMKQDTTVQETVGAVLHHLRQPLTVLTGYAEMLSDDLMNRQLSKEELKKRAERIFNAGMRLNELLRKFEKLKSYKVVRYGEDLKIIDIDTGSDITR